MLFLFCDFACQLAEKVHPDFFDKLAGACACLFMLSAGRCVGIAPLRMGAMNRCRGRRPRRPASCHSEPVTASLAWESVSLREKNGLPRRCAPRSKCPWGTPRNDRMRGDGVSGSKKSKPRRGLLPLFRTVCPAPLPARRWHHPGSRAGDARRGCSAPAGWRWPGHSPPPPM